MKNFTMEQIYLSCRNILNNVKFIVHEDNVTKTYDDMMDVPPIMWWDAIVDYFKILPDGNLEVWMQ